jgi:lipopolysaccharide export system permease protein
MKRLHKFVIKSFLGPFFMTFFICVFVLLMQFVWKYIDEFVGKGLEWTIVVELLSYAAFGLLPLAFPLAMLLASIMTFGNLGENYELVAMKASGISLFRIMRPLFMLAVGMTLIAFYFSNNILPKTNLKFYSLMFSVRQQKPEMVVKEGVFSNDLASYSIKVERKGKNNNMLYDVMIYDHSEDRGNANVSVADSGKMEMSKDKKFMTVTLYNGRSYSEERERTSGAARRYPFERQSFQKEVINISMKDFEFNRIDEKRYSGVSKMMNLSQLESVGDSTFNDYKVRIWRNLSMFNYTPDVNRQLLWLANPVDSLRKNPNIKPDHEVDFDKTFASLSTIDKQALYQRVIGNVRQNSQAISERLDEMYGRKKMINSYAMEWHRKFTLSVACLIFFFIGAPLGAIIRKGGLGMPVVVSILLFISYYIIMIMGEKVAREDAWNMFSGMWLASFIYLPFGVWLTYKAATDSGVMNIESYQAIFKKITSFRFLKRSKTES